MRAWHLDHTESNNFNNVTRAKIMITLKQLGQGALALVLGGALVAAAAGLNGRVHAADQTTAKAKDKTINLVMDERPVAREGKGRFRHRRCRVEPEFLPPEPALPRGIVASPFSEPVQAFETASGIPKTKGECFRI